MAREVILAPEAREDSLQLYDYVAAQAGAARAQRYAERVVAYCQGFVMFPERGTRRRRGLVILAGE